MRQGRSVRALGAVGTLSLVASLIASPTSGLAAADPTYREAREVRTIWTNEFGVPRPDGLAYSPKHDRLLVADAGSTKASILRLTRVGDARGTLRLPPVSAANNFAFDSVGNRLTGLDGDTLLSVAGRDLLDDQPPVDETDVSALGLGDPEGTTYDPDTGRWFVLDDANDVIVRVPGGGRLSAATRIGLGALGTARFRGLAFNPADGLLYVASPDEDLLYGVDTSGTLVETYSLASLDLTSPMGMTFAPSADATDSPDTQHLYIADSGSSTSLGSVTEVTLAAAAAVSAPTVTATYVRTIATSAWNPGSPDPSGIVYIPGPNTLHPDTLMVCDSEVEEVTGAGYHGVNLWQATRTGTVVDTGTTYPAFSKEPTGLGYDPGSDTLFISDDSNDRVWVEGTGPDGRFGTADDVRTSVNARSYGSDDTEDPEFDTTTGQPTSGHLFFLDGTNKEVYDVDPVNGVFGDGNDMMTQFDVGLFGPSDWEGLGSDPTRGTLLVGARTTDEIYEVTKTGTLVRVIDLSGISSEFRYISGLAMAPASDGSGRMNIYIVDRNIDNGSNSSENDGRIVEISIPGSDALPSVSITSPADGSTVSGTVTVQASASDDLGVTQVEFFDGSTSLGVDANAGDGWSATWDTTLTGDGTHTLRATVTDTSGQTSTSAPVDVTVDNVDSPPSVTVTAPASGATVKGSVDVLADASDDKGLTQVEFLLDGSTSLGIDTNAGNGWSATWDTTSAAPGAHALTAVATDTANNTATSDPVNVTVDNTDYPPSVAVTAPASGAIVNGSIGVLADASDDLGLTQVEFFVDGSISLGVDADGSDGWSATWDTTSAAPGAHALTAVATDTGSNTATSDPVNVIVDNVAPSLVAITSPTPGQTVSGAVPVQADASDNQGVTSVQFFVDGSTSIGTDAIGSDGWSVDWNSVTVLNGNHDLTAVASDAVGNSTTSATVTVIVDNPLVFDIPITASTDDAEQFNTKGSTRTDSEDLDMLKDRNTTQVAVGLRFTGIPVPRGAVITNAYVQFQTDTADSNPVSLLVRGQDADNAATFSTVKFNIVNRPMTDATATWNPAPWPTIGQHGPDQRTPELAAIVQEIVDRAGWAPGNAIALIITGSGTGTRVAEAFEGTFAPVLHIEYEMP